MTMMTDDDDFDHDHDDDDDEWRFKTLVITIFPLALPDARCVNASTPSEKE